MELYKSINNEALDEDLKAKRTVMERLKKNYGDIDEQVVSKVEFTKPQKTLLSKAILSLNASIDDIFIKAADSRIKEKYNLGDIPYKYNLLATFINKTLSYKNLEAIDKSYIDENVDKLIPKLQSLNELAKKYEFVDGFLIPKIIDNIRGRTYNTLIELPEIQEKITSLEKQEFKPKGRPRKYTTEEEANKAKIEQQQLRRQKEREVKEQTKQNVKVKTPAEAEVEAEEPDEGDVDYEDNEVIDSLVDTYQEIFRNYESETSNKKKNKMRKELKEIRQQIEALDSSYFE